MSDTVVHGTEGNAGDTDETMVLECRELSRTYDDGDVTVEVLKAVNFAVPRAARVAIVGTSGAGKSTLLNLLGGLDLPDAGQVFMRGRDLATLSEPERCRLRNRELGFVYQFHHLLAEFSALENVMMPLLIGGRKPAAAAPAATAMLRQVGLAARLQHRPAQLSGGERQRVAIARALVAQPSCVLLDEPTGNLDPQSAAQLLQLIDRLKQEAPASFVVVTHDAAIAAHMDAIYRLHDKALIAQPPPHAG